MDEYYSNRFKCYDRKELLKQIDKEHEQNQKLREALEEIARMNGHESEVYQRKAQQALDEVDNSE